MLDVINNPKASRDNFGTKARSRETARLIRMIVGMTVETPIFLNDQLRSLGCWWVVGQL